MTGEDKWRRQVGNIMVHHFQIMAIMVQKQWIPAFAGMTGRAEGMMGGQAGMMGRPLRTTRATCLFHQHVSNLELFQRVFVDFDA